MKFGGTEMPNESLDSNKIIDDLSLWVDLSRRTEEPPFVTHVFLQQVLDLIKRLQTENNDLFYKLAGVMHSVDKWLEGDELKQDEVNRAATMREKTLRTVESLQAENEQFDKKVETEIDKLNAEKNDVMYHKDQIKAESYKEFAEWLKEGELYMQVEFPDTNLRTKAYIVLSDDIDNLLKEKVGGAK